MAEAEGSQYCSACGTKMAFGSKFCPTCGKPTAAAETKPVSETISKDRRTLAYVLGFFIVGAGQMVLGKVARGITFFMIAVIFGIIWGIGMSPVPLIIVFGLWIFSLFDLHKLIQKGKTLGPSLP